MARGSVRWFTEFLWVWSILCRIFIRAREVFLMSAALLPPGIDEPDVCTVASVVT